MLGEPLSIMHDEWVLGSWGMHRLPAFHERQELVGVITTITKYCVCYLVTWARCRVWISGLVYRFVWSLVHPWSTTLQPLGLMAWPGCHTQGWNQRAEGGLSETPEQRAVWAIGWRGCEWVLWRGSPTDLCIWPNLGRLYYEVVIPFSWFWG